MKNSTKHTNLTTKRNKLARFFDALLNVLYPKNIKCIFCGEELTLNSKYSICEYCFDELPYIQRACPKCSSPLSDNNQGVCFNCKNMNYYFDRAFAVLEYSDMMKDFIHRIKYGGAKHSIEPISQLMVNKLITSNINIDCITYVPMFNKKERSRGYNQAKELAKNIADKTNIPIMPLVEKLVDNSNQASLKYEDRIKNVKDVYSVIKQYKNDIKGKSILLVDDIMTTGATVNEVCKLLKSSGAKNCFVLVLCHGRQDSIPMTDTEKL